jgi:hypothetical protein
MPEITLTLAEYDDLRARVDALTKELAAFRRAAGEAAVNALGGPEVVQAFLDARELVSFAVAQLDPRVIKGWPHETLRRFALALNRVPGLDAVQDVIGEYLAFAFEAENEELRRRAAPRAQGTATQADFGPKTPEAEAAHAAMERARNS